MKRIGNMLAEALKEPLPGTDVQWEMASSDRQIDNFPRVPTTDAQIAAVMILLYPDEGKLKIPLIQRTGYGGVHAGQIGLPGGKREKNDKTLTITALRETEEETGIDRSDINTIGILTPLFIPVSNIVVTPVVGWCDSKPQFKPEPREVDQIIEVEAEVIANPAIVKEIPMLVRGDNLMVKYYDYNNYVIWGATAMMLHELLVIMKRQNIPFKL